MINHRTILYVIYLQMLNNQSGLMFKQKEIAMNIIGTLTINTKTIIWQTWMMFVPFFLLASQTKAQSQQISLKECISYTLEHHPSSTIYKYSVKSSEEKIRESKSAFLPSVSGTVGLDYNIKLSTTVVPAGSFSDSETKIQMGSKFSNSAYLEVDQNLFDKSSMIDIKTSKVNKELADLNLVKENESLIYSTASAYYETITYMEKGRLLLESEKQYETTVGILKLQYEKGVVKKSEYDKARVNYANVRAEIESNNSSYKSALNKLKNSMGLNLETAISIENNIPGIEVTNLPISICKTDLNAEQLVDIQIDKKNLELKQLDVKQKKAAYLPTISVYGKYGGNAYGSEFSTTLSRWYDYSIVGLKASIPIFSGFKKKSQVAQSKYDLASQELTNELNLQTYKLNVANASSDIVSAYANLKEMKGNLQLAKEVVDATTIEYKEGTATLSSLLDADYSYKEARTNYTTSLLDYLTAQLSYYKSTGTITQFVNDLK